MKTSPALLTALTLLLHIACNGSPKAAPSGKPPRKSTQEHAMQFKTAKTTSPALLAELCSPTPDPAAIRAVVFRDSAGNIGGYTRQVLIMDSPIYYLDCEGKPLAMFHIFGSDKEKKKNGPIIEAFRKRFPVEEVLVCPDSGKSGAPKP